jgi:hypothetical protein
MATSKDFEKLWKRYQDEVQSTGKSIVTYCQENGIVYAQFEKWYKKRVNPTEKNPSIVPIEVTDIPSEVEAPRHESPRNPNQDPMWIRSFTIQFRNGLEIRHQNISYSSLASLVKKMEGLC